jgi:lysophospholipase L1-like esterase
MKKRRLWLALALLGACVLASSDYSPAQDAKTPEKSGEKKINLAATPTPAGRLGKQHKQYLERAKKGDIDVLLMGDSIMTGWQTVGKDSYQKYWAPLKVANFGISGDTTQGVLGRIEDGELDGYDPKMMLLLIGTNNVRFVSIEKTMTSEQIAEAIGLIVKKFRDKHPRAKVLLMGIFPRGEIDNPRREPIKEVNRLISKLDDGKFVKFMDIGDKFTDKDGKIFPKYMNDSQILHPTAEGYQVWIEAIWPTVQEWLALPKDAPKDEKAAK